MGVVDYDKIVIEVFIYFFKLLNLAENISEIQELKKICKHFNTDCIILDHTHPVLNFPVIRVIIPRISDFLPFLSQDILVSEATRPSATWRGERYRKIMQSFFA